MEDPATWDRLTAAVAVSRRAPADVRWSFLVDLGLADGTDPDATRRFADILADVGDREPVPGPSDASVIARALQAAGLCSPLGAQPDPYGEGARKAWQEQHRDETAS